MSSIISGSRNLKWDFYAKINDQEISQNLNISLLIGLEWIALHIDTSHNFIGHVFLTLQSFKHVKVSFWTPSIISM